MHLKTKPYKKLLLQASIAFHPKPGIAYSSVSDKTMSLQPWTDPPTKQHCQPQGNAANVAHNY